MVETIAAFTTPLCFLPDGKLVCYQHGDIVVYTDYQEQLRFSLFETFRERYLGHCKLLCRLLRLGVRTAIAVDDSAVVLSVGNSLYELNIGTGSLSKRTFCDEGVRPLSFSHVKSIVNFKDGIYYGEYVRNFKKQPVNIYYRKDEDEWEIVYTFPQGVINHIHAIVPDPYRNCLWVLTGDFGDSAAIWKVTDGFNKVECFVSGEQKWRGCVAFTVPEGLIYATDAPFAENHIYLLKEDGTATIVGDLSGSCIYGCNWNGKYVFSTVVEPDGRNETLLRLLFGWKRGSGIEDNYARIYCGNLKSGFNLIYQEKKDIWPFIFQFGAFKFPAGNNTSKNLYFQSVATNKSDLCLMTIK